MERESAVREILQSIGPLFPEDAQRARTARKQAEHAAAEPVAEQPVEERVLVAASSKPVLASQVDGPNMQKTHVANLAAVLDRLTPPPPAESVRDAVPHLVRRAVPDVSALRAALDGRDVAAPVFTPAAPPVFEAEEPVVEAIAEPAPEVTPEPVLEATPATPQPVDDEDDAFVAAVAEALLVDIDEMAQTPIGDTIPDVMWEPEALVEPAPESIATFTELAPEIPAEVEPAPVEPDPAPVETAVTATPKTKRTKSKKQHEPVAEAATVPTVPDTMPADEPAPASGEDDELIRQIRTHRADMIDVDDQLARLDQEIAAEKQEMARYVSIVEQKNAYRSRLVRLRTSTQRFVETLQVKAEPVKRTPKERKSA